MLTKIISGGQTGADQGGLEAGKELGLITGGTAPMGWRTEKGPNSKLLSEYGLVECSLPGYPARTELNILNSDGTVIFGNIDEPGSSLTLTLCRKLKKPYLVNPSIEEFLNFVEVWPISTLNVAGNRESKNPGIQKRVRDFLIKELAK